MRKRWIALVAALSVTALLSACGGGGGGGGASAKAVSKKAVSGTVALSGTVGKAALADAADVEITSYEKTPQLDKDNQPIPLDRILLNTGAIGAFSGQISMADAGGYLVLVVKKNGYTDYIKRVDFDKPNDVNLRALLAQVNTVYQNISTTRTTPVTISAAGKPVQAFTFAVVSYPDGTRKTVAGPALKAAKAAGATTELKVDIPVDSLKDTNGNLLTNTLVGKLKSFDSSDPGDADKFPGDYADANGNRLVSLGFDYINIADGSGNNLGGIVKTAKAAGKLSKSAAATPTIVTRHIPSGSCNNLLNDFCTGAATDDPLCANLDATSKAGFNVPIYTNNSRKGSWDLLGLGTVDVNNDGVIDASDAAANVSKTACTTAGGYYLRILVTNEDFIKSWWNLDYPLLFAQPKVLCVSGTVKDDKNNPLSVWLNLYDDDAVQSFNYAYASTDSSGAYTMKAVLLDSADTDRTGAISYYNPFGYQYVTKTPVTLGDWPNNCGKADITITKPLRCVAEGTVVKDDGTPTGSSGGTIPKITAKLVGTPGVTVQINSSSSSYFYTSAVTDANGFFTAEVACNTDLDVYLGNNWNVKAATFNANGTVDPLSEKSDTAATTSAPGKVVLKDLQPVNQAPIGYGYLSPSSIRDTESATVYIYAYDPDGDYPLSYSLTSGTAINKTGSIPSGSSSVNVSLSGLAVGSYPLTLVVTDSRGKPSTSYNVGILRVTHLNRNPVISSATSTPTTIDPTVTTNRTFSFSGAATDPDGDTPLTYAWRVTSGTTTVATPTGANASFTVPTTATDPTTYTVVLTVTDGKGGTASSTPFDIFYKSPPSSNVAPVITSAQSDKLAVKPGDASRVFTFTATAQDQNNDTLTFAWTVNGTSIGTGSPVNFTVPAGAADPTTYVVVVTVSDGKGGTATRTFDVFYASGSNTTVTVQ